MFCAVALLDGKSKGTANLDVLGSYGTFDIICVGHLGMVDPLADRERTETGEKVGEEGSSLKWIVLSVHDFPVSLY